MNFVQPSFLVALGALSIPLIIHLLRSRKVRTLDLGTLRFVREAMSETTRWRRLREWLLLLLRLAMVALAVLLFARPFRDEVKPPPGKEAGAEWICVLDASASMRFQKPGSTQAGTVPPNAALKLFEKQLASVPEGIRAVPLLLADSVRELSSSEEAGPAIGGACDYAALTRWITARAAANPAVPRRVFFFTDLQQPSASLPEDLNWPEAVPLEIVSVLPPSTANLSLEPPSRRIQPYIKGKESTLELPLERSGSSAPQKFTARAGAGRDLRSLEDREYAADISAIELKLKPARPGDIEAVARVKGMDPWPLDDQCDLTLRFTERLPVLLLDGDPGEGNDASNAPRDSPFASETYYLRQALSTPERGSSAGGYDVTVSYDSIETLPAKPWRAIALCNVSGLSDLGIRVLTDKVKAGAGLLLFPGDKTDAAAWRRLTEAGLCPAEISLKDDIAVPRPLAEWDATNPPLAAFTAREEGDLSRIILKDRFRVQPSPGAKVLASMDGQRPALVAGTLGQGRVLLFANPVDRAWTDFPSEKLFLPFVHALCAYAAKVSANGEEGLPAMRDVTLADRLLPGRQGDKILRVPATESTLPFLDEETFRKTLRLGAAPPPVTLARQEAWRKVEGAARPDEWWPWFALGLLLFLAAETFLADHTRPVRAPADATS